MDNIRQMGNNDLENFFYNLPDNELVIVEFLRDLVFECIPHCKERLSYNVPYYYGNQRICYIWPSSTPMSGVDEGVVLGFCDGMRLEDSLNFLDKGSRKQVCTKTFLTLTQALQDRDKIKTYLFEASRVDTLVQ